MRHVHFIRYTTQLILMGLTETNVAIVLVLVPVLLLLTVKTMMKSLLIKCLSSL